MKQRSPGPVERPLVDDPQQSIKAPGSGRSDVMAFPIAKALIAHG